MPTPGLSLVGFMEQQHALNYMRANCVMPDPSDAALIAEWTAAKNKLGSSFDDAGHPDIQPIPPGNQPYMQGLQQQQWVQSGLPPNATFQIVEIDPLLAFQFHILTDHSDDHCNRLGLGPGIADLLPICLPQAPPQANLRLSGAGQSLLIAADSLNVRIFNQGWFQTENKAGIAFGISLPFVHVVRFNGRCYLTNGFHRALGARKRGAGRMPCLFRDVGSATEVGIQLDGTTFSLALLESADPPTLRHFTQGRAHELPIQRKMRVLQVNWSEHALPME
jgi:hypothetical protein